MQFRLDIHSTDFPRILRYYTRGRVLRLRPRRGMATIDREAPLHFLCTAFVPGDCVAIFLKSYRSGDVAQRVGDLRWVQTDPVQRWLRAMNARMFNIFVSVNAIATGRRSRTRDAIATVRHVFLDADHDGPAVLARVRARSDLPEPSYVLHSSPNHMHIFWRVVGFEQASVERLQKYLARELQTDSAATPVTQNTRLSDISSDRMWTAIYVDEHQRARKTTECIER